MTLTRDHLRRIVAVAHARNLRFVELVGLAELDPAKAFRGVVIRGADLSRQDLAGFDFTGTKFIGCDLRGADLSRAIGVSPDALERANTDGETQLPPTLRAAFWATGQPPSWAADWGHDTYGPWVSFRVPGTEVTQRMRWIPPGQFLMGSPKTERGHFKWEGPQHKVTIAEGFWMFETACTEPLWSAVMGAPPRFAGGPEFPVTGVSWDEARDFAQSLNTMLPDLAIGLPSEAKWEYACRAGTDTTYNFGNRISKKRVRYGSGGPVTTGSLPPNQWGLCEMHGNIWEWCEDHWHDDYTGAPDDGAAWLDDDAARRVIRGGSWSYDARDVRAACRDGIDPGDRDDSLGFRCARVRERSGAEKAEPAALVKGRKRGAPPRARAEGDGSPRSGEKISATRRKRARVP